MSYPPSSARNTTARHAVREALEGVGVPNVKPCGEFVVILNFRGELEDMWVGARVGISGIGDHERSMYAWTRQG